VWFWSAPDSAADGSHLVREVSIPKGTALFLSIRDAEVSSIEEPPFFVRLQPPDAPLRFLLHPDLRDGGQHLPFLVREAQQVAEDRQGSIDARRREPRRLTVLVLPTDRQGSQACPP